MKYFILNILGDHRDRALAFIDHPPTGIGLYSYCMAKGEAAAAHYPTDAKIYLAPRSPGVKLASFIGNTQSYLIVCTEMKNVISEICNCPLEVLPFTLYNHKKRIHSKDYWIVNPLGSRDCLNKTASDIEYLDETKKDVVAVEKFVLDAKRTTNLPDLFRVPEDPKRYFISERLGRAFHEKRFSNVLLFEVAQK